MAVIKLQWCVGLFMLVSGMAQAIEQTAATPVDEGRRADEAKVKSTLRPAGCVSSTQGQAAKKCPVACQINVPTTKLTVADSCATQAWECRWPRQAVSVSESCPAGWTGSLTKDEVYEVQSCGSKLEDTGEFTVSVIGCTRTVADTSTTACPTGGDWAGSGITKSRTRIESLNADLSTVVTISSADWVVTNVACTRVVNKEDYTLCPLPSVNTCTRYVMQNSGNLISSTCAGTNPPLNANGTTTAVTQHLANDLLTAVTDATGSPSTTVVSCYAPCALPWGGSIAEGQSVTAYTATAVAAGQSCASVAQTRTCTKGVLTGSGTNSACTVNCALPWGGEIASGQTVVAYAASSVAYGSSCQSESRSCNNGTLSGSYASKTCTVQPQTCGYRTFEACGCFRGSSGGPTVGIVYTCPVGVPGSTCYRAPVPQAGYPFVCY